MSIRQLKALVAVHQHGSFAKAAEALFLTQSAISMQIQSLEQHCQTELFDRSTRPPQLTPAGHNMLERAKRALHHYHDAFESFTGDDFSQETCRLGIVPTALIPMLPKILLMLREQAAEVTFQISSELSGILSDQVAERVIDAALISKPKHIPKWFNWSPVIHQRVVLIAPPDSTGESVHELFRYHPYICFNRDAWIAPAIKQRLSQMQIFPQTKAEIASIEAIQMMVSTGFGISVIPAFSSWQLPYSFRVLELGDPPLYRPLGLLSHKDAGNDKIQMTLLNVMKLAAKM